MKYLSRIDEASVALLEAEKLLKPLAEERMDILIIVNNIQMMQEKLNRVKDNLTKED